MPSNKLCLYLDDSGTRNPDKKQGKKPKHGQDWFSIGGFLINEQDINVFENSHDEFCKKWNITAPLHSSEIRACSGKFSFIGKLDQEKRNEFFKDIHDLVCEAPIRLVACVIDRPGYKNRYDKYGVDKWNLCKTAYSIVLERACKVAAKEQRRLNVNIERCDKKTDKVIKGYHEDLKASGMPFDNSNAGKYRPLTAENFSNILYDLKFKRKTSRLTQLADLCLWPICIGGYDKDNLSYKRLVKDKKIIDFHIKDDEVEELGVKYSCWELASKNK